MGMSLALQVFGHKPAGSVTDEKKDVHSIQKDSSSKHHQYLH